MTILYKVQNPKKESTALQQRSLCRVSVKNVVAYSVAQTVFVCDITSPWLLWKVCTTKNTITALDWNTTGELLLVATKGGIIEIWSAKNYTQNNWEMLYKATFLNEDILNARFFHNGRSFLFNSQKKELSLYSEKFERMDQRPSLVRFGNAPAEGFIAVTSSGLVGVVVIPSGQITETERANELSPVYHRLNTQRAAFNCCSIAFNNDGSLNLAAYGPKCPQAIFCFKLTLRYNYEQNVCLTCEALPTVFTTSNNVRKVAFIRSCIINSEYVLFVAYRQLHEGSVLEQWNLIKKAQMVHKLLQKNKTDIVQTDCWENISKVNFNTEIQAICISKLLADFVQIAAILKDNTVHIFETGLKKLVERVIDDRECQFVTGDLTYMNQILFIIDNQGQIYAVQMPFAHLDKGYKPLSLQTSMLEYCIVTGIDATDILLLNPLNIELLVEKLTENFTRQHSYAKQHYYSNFLSLKSSMCRMQTKQQDFDNLIMLHSISITFKSLLRPSELSQDKGPADNLSIILSEPIADVDKVLFNLDAKDFTVEPPTLQSLQQLIQWVADLAFNILNRLPEEAMKPKLSKKQGYDISRDIAAISSIRELLVMIRIWGLLNAQCLPIYTKSVENIDVLSILFRLLTRLAQNPNEPDEMLLDECSVLSSQVLVPSREPHTSSTTLLSAMKSFPLVFTVGITPPNLQELQFEEVVFSRGTKDGVSNIHLGSRVKTIRKCVRCGFVNDSQKNPKTSALKAWFNRWLYCVCGGFWIK